MFALGQLKDVIMHARNYTIDKLRKEKQKK